MAEFCLECWKEMRGEKGKGKRLVMSSGVDFCEGCGQWKPVVLWEQDHPVYEFHPVWLLLKLLRMCITLPYKVYQLWKARRRKREDAKNEDASLRYQKPNALGDKRIKNKF